MSNYKLIALDLDGTLLNSEKKISKENKLAIQKAIRQGVRVVISTGRVFIGAKAFAKEAGVFEPIIACNGAIIKEIDSGKVHYVNPMRVEDCVEAVKLCKEYDVYFHIFIEDTLYTERLEKAALAYWNKNLQISEEQRLNILVTEDILEVIKNAKGNILKIIVISQDIEKLSKLRRQVSQIESVDLVSSDIDNFEVINKGVSKGSALAFLTDKYDIKPEEIIAFGDNENDISMIEFAGMGVAMGNGLDELKERANFITLGNNDDGVAVVINKYF